MNRSNKNETHRSRVKRVQETCFQLFCLRGSTHFERVVTYGTRLIQRRCFNLLVTDSRRYLCPMRLSGLHAVLWSHIGILMRLPAAEPRSTAGLLFPSLYLSGTLWLTPYSMVWDWRVWRPGPRPFCWPSCSLLFCLQLFSLSLLFLYWLVVWGWSLRTDRVAISLSRPCIANLF